jgi:hypothetical protein
LLETVVLALLLQLLDLALQEQVVVEVVIYQTPQPELLVLAAQAVVVMEQQVVLPLLMGRLIPEVVVEVPLIT